MTFGNANSPVSKQKLTLHPKLHPKKPTTKCWGKTLEAGTKLAIMLNPANVNIR